MSTGLNVKEELSRASQATSNLNLDESWKEIWKRRFFDVYFPPIIALTFLLVIWQFGVQLANIPNYILPKPSDIFSAAVENWANLFQSMVRTIGAAIIGFIGSVVGGILGALIMASSSFLQKSLYPYAVILQTTPIVAIAPIIVIWFGSGLNAISVIAFIIGFFPMLSNTFVGLTSSDKNMVNLFRMYSASKRQMMFKLRLPAALPYIMAGLKISCTLAIVGAIVGEYVAGVGGGEGGLGYAITVSAARLQTPYLFALALGSSVLGICFFMVISAFSKRSLKSWHESEMKTEN